MSLFKIKTSESYSIKILAELLQNCLKEAAFIVTPDGLTLTCIDKRSSRGTLCIDMTLSSTNFPIYKCNRERYVLGMNLLHFYKQLKSIKKKDVLTLEITEKDPQLLNISVQQGSDTNPMISTVQVTNLQPNDIDVNGDPDKTTWGNPIVCPSKDFAKLRTFHKVGAIVTMKFTKTWVLFSCGDVMTRQLPFGEYDPLEAESSKDVHTHQFSTDNLTQLVKVSGLSANVQLYVHENLPLKIKMNVGSLGSLSILLKSNKQIEAEEDDEDYAVTEFQDKLV